MSGTNPAGSAHGGLYGAESRDAAAPTVPGSADIVNAIRRVQVYDGDGERVLDVGVVASDAPVLQAFLADVTQMDVYDDPMPSLDRRSGVVPPPLSPLSSEM